MVFTTRPVLMGTHGAVASGHYLATVAGFKVLQKGGNAVDAGVAMGFTLTVLEPHANGIGGEAPIIVYSAGDKRVSVINGQGTAPKKATFQWFREQGINVIPGDGFLPATVPSAFDAWITALSRFGTLSLAETMEPAIKFAEEGFPMYQGLRNVITLHAKRFREEWPTTAKVFLPNCEVPEVGEVFRQTSLAETFKRLVAEEERAQHKGRTVALKAARDCFYNGEIAKRIVEFGAGNEVRDSSGKPHSALLSLEDFKGYETKVEEPVSFNYKGLTVHKCSPWSQGPVFLQQLSLLRGYDLRSLRHNSTVYIHLIVEAAKLAFADREKFYGDPDFGNVPVGKLLSEDYALERRKLIKPDKASVELRPGSDIHAQTGNIGDTTHLDAVDADGNMVAATPSGGWVQSSPVIEGLGFPLGTRGQMFNLDVGHPNGLQPGKRPRTTLTPSLVTRDRKPYMVFGTPGGDQQDQWTLQFFLNLVEFGMNLQEAIDAPTFHTAHFPSSFYPREASPGRLHVEGRIPEAVRKSLVEKGHDVVVDGDWAHGRVLAIAFNPETGVISAAASPRGETGYALSW